ncbi:MAG: serine/threonine-protein kinase [Acidimicrobiales bacterium]
MISGPGKLIGDRYLVDGVVARGPVADVYRARDQELGRPVAVKVLRAGAVDDRRFETDTNLLSLLEHRNLVRLLDAGLRAGVPYLVFEVVEGRPLAHWLARGPLDLTAARHLGCDVARALAYLHAQGVVHGLVEPSNILLAPDGRALLGHLAMSRLLTDQNVDGTSADDVAALGLVLIEALSGNPTGSGTTAGLALAPTIPPGLERPWPSLLQAMTRPDPEARPDAATIAAHLQPLAGADLGADTEKLDTIEIAEAPAPAAGRPVDPIRRASTFSSAELRPVLWLMAALVGLLGLLTYVITSESPGDDRSVEQVADGTIASAAVPTTTTTLATTTTVTSTTIAPAAVSSADACASLTAREQAIETERRQVDQSHRGDRDTRERLTDQLEAEQQAIHDQRDALDC